jgi:hypothetical protein
MGSVGVAVVGSGVGIVGPAVADGQVEDAAEGLDEEVVAHMTLSSTPSFLVSW